jgi:hypothetical protein
LGTIHILRNHFFFIKTTTFSHILEYFSSSLCILCFSNVSMKISSKCNVEKIHSFVLTKKPSFCEKFGSQIKFCAIKCLRNIWMVPCQLKLSSFLHQGSHGLLCTWLWHSYQLKNSNFCKKNLKMVFCYKNCSDLLCEKLLISRLNFMRSLEQSIQTLKGQNNIW